MADQPRFTNTDSTAGGDGTTNNTAGADRAYATMNEWESNEQQDLVSAGDTARNTCTAPSGTSDTTATQIIGWDTDAIDYILIEAAASDRAEKTGINTAKYRLSVSNAVALRINEAAVRVDGLQIEITGTNANRQNPLIIIGAAGTTNDQRISNCYLKQFGGATFIEQGIQVGGANAVVLCWNTIVDNIGSVVSSDNAGFYLLNGVTADFYNCIAKDGHRGFRRAAGTMTVTNSASFNHTSSDFQGTITVDFCLSDDGTGSNAQTPSGGDIDNEYLDSANGDFTLVAAGNADGGGTDDPASGLFSTDMDGDSYVSTWPIGVDEIAAAGEILTAESGSFTLTGTAATLLKSSLLTADPGTYSLTGQDAQLLKGHLLTAESGTYLLAGQDAGLLHGSILSAESGSFILTGQDAGLFHGHLITCESGTFLLSGQDADLIRDHLLSAESAAFILTGQDATLIHSAAGEIITAESGSFLVTGQDAQLLKSSLLNADSGSFTFTGFDATLTFSGSTLAQGLVRIVGTAKPFKVSGTGKLFVVTGTGKPFTISGNDGG